MKESALSPPDDYVGSAGPTHTQDSDDVRLKEPFIGFVNNYIS